MDQMLFVPIALIIILCLIVLLRRDEFGEG